MNRQKVAPIGYGLLLLGLIAAPFLGAYPMFVMKLLCFALFASAFNLLLGYTGLLSFGHAAFLGGAAYVTGHAVKVWGPPRARPADRPAGRRAAGAGDGLLRHPPPGHLRHHDHPGAGADAVLCGLQAPFTGGEDGLQGVPRGKLFGVLDLSSDLTMYYVCLVWWRRPSCSSCAPSTRLLARCSSGIKENEPRATSLGYDTNRFKLLAFVISAAIAGLAGALKTLVLGFATLSDVHWSASGHVVLMTLVGGMGTLSGPLVGAAVVVALENKIGDLGTLLAQLTSIDWFNTLGESVTIVTGLIFVVCVLAFRRGIMGEIIAWLERRRTGGSGSH